MKKIGIVCAVLILQADVYAEDIKTEEGIKQLCDQSAQAFGKGNVEETFNILKPYFNFPKEEISNLIYQTSALLKQNKERRGDFIGHEFLSTKKLGSSYIRYNYLIKLEKTPLRFRCFAYKAHDTWSIQSIFWDDKPYLYFK